METVERLEALDKHLELMIDRLEDVNFIHEDEELVEPAVRGLVLSAVQGIHTLVGRLVNGQS